MKDFIPSKFYLSQNAPNPFSDETKIKYCIPVTSQVYLAVFSVDDDVIEVLVDRIQNPGTYEVIYNNLHNSKGEYYYRINAKQHTNGYSQIFNQSKRMIVT